MRIALVLATTALTCAQEAAHIGDLQSKLAAVDGLAQKLFEAGRLRGPEVAALDGEIEQVERQAKALDSAQQHEILAMAGILRGTLYRQGTDLSDEQVEKVRATHSFASPEFWDQYYQDPKTISTRFDWYGTWETVLRTDKATTTLGSLLKNWLYQDAKILMIGCGRSDISERMYQDGFEELVNIDISEALVSSLRDELATRMPRMRWMRMNASALEFSAESFDAVIDKGTFDSLQEDAPLLDAAVREAHRVLRPGGVLISVTDLPAEIRVRGQLQSLAAWARCSSQAAELADSEAEAPATHGGQVRVLHVHACVRPLGRAGGWSAWLTGLLGGLGLGEL